MSTTIDMVVNVETFWLVRGETEPMGIKDRPTCASHAPRNTRGNRQSRTTDGLA